MKSPHRIGGIVCGAERTTILMPRTQPKRYIAREVFTIIYLRLKEHNQTRAAT